VLELKETAMPPLAAAQRRPRRTVARALAVLATAAASLADASSEPWPEIPSPPKSRVEWLADSMRVNGVPMRVMHFDSSRDRSTIVEYYRAYWSGYPTKPSVRTAPSETVMGQAHGPYFMTVEVKDAANGGSAGVIAVSRPIGAKIDRSPGELPLMPGAKVLQVVESNDPGRSDRELLVKNPVPLSSVVHYYQAALVDAGWRSVQYSDVERKGARRAGAFLVYRREHSELELSAVASADGRSSTLLANLVTKDTGPHRF
jgi:hypothetical protein